MLARPEDVALLHLLLSSSSGQRTSPAIEDARFLRRLVDSAPAILRRQRRVTLFEAIRVLDLELPHSDYLAWLLDPFGPLTDNWLLKALLKRVAPDQAWEDDAIVEREVSVANGRLDILITWNSFKLVVENKLWSSQGDDQIPRYLACGEIPTSDDGRIIYLTREGEWPKGVKRNEARVVALSYGALHEMLRSGIHDHEPSTRDTAFASEFRDCIARFSKDRWDMTKPEISDSTKIFLGNAKRIAEIRSNAIAEFQDFLHWMRAEAERELRPILGNDLLVHPGKFVVVFYLPAWKQGDVVFGLDFGMDVNPAKRLLSEPSEGPWAGIGAWRSDDSIDEAGCKVIVDYLHPLLQKSWPHKEDLRAPDYSMPLWREFRIPPDGDIEKWAGEIIHFFKELGSTLRPALDAAANGLNDSLLTKSR